jgi:hypothetical protein
VRPAHGFLEHEAERILRADDRKIALHTVVELGGMTAEVTEVTGDGRPAEAVFRFRAALEDEGIVWMKWTKDGFVKWGVPAVGERVRLPAFDLRRFVLEEESEMKGGR